MPLKRFPFSSSVFHDGDVNTAKVFRVLAMTNRHHRNWLAVNTGQVDPQRTWIICNDHVVTECGTENGLEFGSSGRHCIALHRGKAGLCRKIRV